MICTFPKYLSENTFFKIHNLELSRLGTCSVETSEYIQMLEILLNETEKTIKYLFKLSFAYVWVASGLYFKNETWF